MRTALVRMAAADPFARFVPSSTPALAPEPDAPTMTLQEVIAPPRGVPEIETTVPEIREAPPCSLTVTLDKSSYNAGETVTGTVKIENDVAMVAKVSEPARTRPPDAPRPSPPRTKVDVHVTSTRSPSLGTTPQSDDVHPRFLPRFLPQRVEVTIQGRERVTLQRTRVIPEQELAPFHHLQGRSHKEHHAHLRLKPKPEVRNLVAERDWRVRNGHVSQGKTVTIVEDETQIETVFLERRVVLQLPGVRGGDLSAGTREEAFSAVVPRTAPSAFYVAGGNWSHGKGYLAEIVYTASAAMVGPDGAPVGGAAHGGSTIGTGPAAPAVSLGDGETLLASAKRHFLVSQALVNPAMSMMSGSSMGGSMHVSQQQSHTSYDTVSYANPLAGADGGVGFTGPTVSGSRQFMTGGNLRATVTLDRGAYSPGTDSAVVKLEVNCSSAQACTMVGFHAVCSMNLVANAQKWSQTFELQKESAGTRHPGFSPGYYGERFLPLRFPPGWPATTYGALVRCNYGARCVLYLPKTFDTTLDAPVVVSPSASMYSAARPAGAPFAGPEADLPPPPELPPPRIFRPLWVDDAAAHACRGCYSQFGVFNRRHHCRQCGHVFCKKCAGEKRPLPRLGYQTPQRVCRGCLPEAHRTGGSFTPVEERLDAGYWAARMAHPGVGPTPPVPTAFERGAGHSTVSTGGDAEFQREARFSVDGGDARAVIGGEPGAVVLPPQATLTAELQ